MSIKIKLYVELRETCLLLPSYQGHMLFEEKKRFNTIFFHLGGKNNSMPFLIT